MHDIKQTRTTGTPLGQATTAAILLHGRGGSAEDMLSLARHLTRPGVAFLVPQAADYTWYPNRFLAPLASNEPSLSSALALVGGLVEQVGEAGVAADRVVILGFSQGACLALEYAARHARRYQAVIALSGALIGPPGTPRTDRPGLAQTPVFLGCSDQDFHVPATSVEESAGVMRMLGGAVDLRLYPGMGHTINQEELGVVAGLLG